MHTGADPRPLRAVSLGCLASWTVLVAGQAGWIPWLRHAWATNLWQYFPVWVALALAASTLALCFPCIRLALLASATWLADRCGELRWSRPSTLLGIYLLLIATLWLVRDQQLLGDAKILIWQAASGMRFLFPDVGATFLIWTVVRAARALGLDHPGVVAALQLAACACGALVILCVWRAGHHLVPGRGGSAALLILSGGLLRVCAGHIEVYAFLLAAAAAYLWRALALLDGRGSWTGPCLALGVAIWLHPSALALLPSLWVLLAAAPGPRRRVVSGLGLAALPGLLLLPVILAVSDRATLDYAFETLLVVAGRGGDTAAPHRWVRGWGGAPGVGTDYVLLAAPHLKYLANAGHLLCAWAAPALLLAVWRRPPGAFRAPPTRFLAVASLPLVLYALLLRPIWGPFDWDLFALTALFVAALAVRLLAAAIPDATYRHVSMWLIGFNLLFVGGPLLAIGFAPIRAAGPFLPEAFDARMVDPGSDAFRRIAPWL
jgi:hypothetical protein